MEVKGVSPSPTNVPNPQVEEPFTLKLIFAAPPATRWLRVGA